MKNSMILGLRISGSIFGLVAILHLLRIISGASVMIDCWLMPIWVNVMGLVGGGFLCVWLWMLSMSKDR
jgi:hypothetical protein